LPVRLHPSRTLVISVPFRPKRPASTSGTRSSNPLSSSKESAANSVQVQASAGSPVVYRKRACASVGRANNRSGPAGCAHAPVSGRVEAPWSEIGMVARRPYPAGLSRICTSNLSRAFGAMRRSLPSIEMC
jgi:hypothetical protein